MLLLIKYKSWCWQCKAPILELHFFFWIKKKINHRAPTAYVEPLVRTAHFPAFLITLAYGHRTNPPEEPSSSLRQLFWTTPTGKLESSDKTNRATDPSWGLTQLGLEAHLRDRDAFTKCLNNCSISLVVKLLKFHHFCWKLPLIGLSWERSPRKPQPKLLRDLRIKEAASQIHPEQTGPEQLLASDRTPKPLGKIPTL